MRYDDLTIKQRIELLSALNDIKVVYAWALDQSHIKKPLAYAIHQVWKQVDKGTEE